MVTGLCGTFDDAPCPFERTAAFLKGGVHAVARCLGAIAGTAMTTPPTESSLPETLPPTAHPAAPAALNDASDRELLAQVAAGHEESC